MNRDLPNEPPYDDDNEFGNNFDHQDDFGNEFDNQNEKIQRILNEKKRQELAERYGANFDHTNPSLPADVEAEWLNYIEEFEQQFENAARVSVHEYLGYPIVMSLSAIAPENLAEELDGLLEFMYLHGVAVHFLADVDDYEAYRFIVEELFDEEVDDVRIPGMTTNFIYEEFHPNDEYDAKIWAQDFLMSLLGHHREGVEIALSQEELYTAANLPTTFDRMMHQVDAFFTRHPTIVDTTIEPVSCVLDNNYAQVSLATTWTSVRTEPDDQLKYIGRAELRLKRCDHGGWDVVQAKVPGWDSPV